LQIVPEEHHIPFHFRHVVKNKKREAQEREERGRQDRLKQCGPDRSISLASFSVHKSACLNASTASQIQCVRFPDFRPEEAQTKSQGHRGNKHPSLEPTPPCL